MTCVVYWLFDAECSDPWRHGYVGVSVNFNNRLKHHLANKRGAMFEHKILFTGTVAECYALEARMRPSEFIGWNIACGGEGGNSQPRSAETRKRMSEAALLRFSDPKQREAMSKAQMGRKVTWAAKIAASKFGTKLSAETRAKMSAARKGRPAPPRTAEHCANISAAKTGKTAPHVSESNRRRKGIKIGSPSPEHRENISRAKTGIPNLKNRGVKKPWLAELNRARATP